MVEHWLEISDEGIDEQRIAQRVEAQRAQGDEAMEAGDDPLKVARMLWTEMIGETEPPSDLVEGLYGLDCDIVPRRYVIDWQTPIIGPIYAFVRRIINAEIRRYLMPSLEKQTLLNQRLVDALHALAEENDRLRQEIAALRDSQDAP